MIEWLFISSVIIFVFCFVIGVGASMYYDDQVEKQFKCYNALVNIMTWAVFAIIPTGILTLIYKLISK